MVGASETPYDLRFRFLDVPVRIHPMFWLVSAVLGWQDHDLGAVALWVACVFVSILVHEYGHALMAKAYDCSPSIVLWGLGGLCYSQAERQTPLQRLAVILSGPGAGFGLFGLLLLLTSLLFQISPGEHLQSILSLVRLAPFPGQHRSSSSGTCTAYDARRSFWRGRTICYLDQPDVGPCQSATTLAAGRWTGAQILLSSSTAREARTGAMSYRSWWQGVSPSSSGT